MQKISMVGELLIRAGLVDEPALERGDELQAKGGGTLVHALSSLALVDEEAATAVVAQGLHLDRLGSELPEVSDEAKALLRPDFCHKHMMVPLEIQGKTVRLALTDPLDYSAIQDVEFLSAKKVVAVIASQTAMEKLLNRLYPQETELQRSYSMLSRAKPEGEIEEEEYEVVDAARVAKDTLLPPIVRLVNLILTDAAKARASDIHIEPNELGLLVRHRVDGMLQDVLKIPKDIQDSTISRLKIISHMDIADRRRPQDGRCRLRIEGKRLDLRVSTLPTQFGEKVVIRILENIKARLPMEYLDLTPINLHAFQNSLSRPQGMILVTGPTGSGKTSTLYTALNWIKSPTNNIITVEDPIEIQLPGVNQMQINPKAGVTFANGLRSILRQDPDIILVGEIRDHDTAEIAVEAAQTGHLLLSTLHTNDAPSTITRLVDLGLEPFQLSSVLVAILAQRLVRKVCAVCATPQTPSPQVIDKAGGAPSMPDHPDWRAGKGCAECGQTGYRGRLAIHELLQMNDELRAMVARRAPDYEIRNAARAGGMRTLMEDGIAKAAQGLTTLEELLRAVAKDEAPATRADRRADPGAGAASEVSLTGKRVLVVEDSPTVSTVVKYFLELEGFEVLVAENGLLGLEAAKRDHPHVIVSDVKMPGMDGMAMVKALRADPETREAAIMLLTSESSVESEAEGLAAGADDYVLKPVEPRRLAARVRAVLTRSMARKAAASTGAAPAEPPAKPNEPAMAA
jgi:type IV pilus assembly protein PilB